MMAWFNFAGAMALAVSATSATVPEGEVPATPDAPATDEATDVLEMQADRYRRMTVPVTINGQGPFNFMVDTGAQASVLSNSLADQLQLSDRGTATLVGMVSRREVETARISDLTFGSRSYQGGVAALVAGGNIGGADGILGLDSLQDRRILLDFKNRRMEVAHEDDSTSNRGFEIVVRARQIEGQLIIARARIDGVRTAVIVDTGAQGSIGNDALYERMRRARVDVESELTDINGVEASGTVRVARGLEMGRAQLSDFPIIFTDTPMFAALGLEDEPALILGMNELRLFERVAIDFPSRRVLFDVADGAGIPRANRFGR